MPYGNEGLEEIEKRIFKRLMPADEFAAVIVEPIQGEGGYVVPEDDFLPRLRELCDRHGILLIADEVQSGAGRTGKMWAIQHWDVEPDILLTAKGIGSGMPVGAMIAKSEVMTWGPGAHGSTYGGNPVALAALLETVRLLEGGLIANAGHPRPPGHGRPPAARGPVPGHRQGRPRQGPDDRHPVRLRRDRRRRQMQAFDRGLLVLEAGDDCVRMSPPLVVTQAEADDRDPDLHGVGGARRGHRAEDVAERKAATRAGYVTEGFGASGRWGRRRRPTHPAHLIEQERRPMPGKVASMRDAIADLVRDGDTVAIEGFTHLIGFSAGHEIIRQRKRDLTLARMTPDLIYDQMIAGGVARKLIFSWLGNPGVGGLNAIRRRIEPASVGEGTPLEVEEYSHFGMVARYTAGAANLPFMPLRSYFETDLPKANPLIRPIKSPYSDEVVYAVPPLNPDVTVIHAQRADANGNTQIWGLLGCQKEAAFAADRVIVVVEELVDEAVIRADPNRTVIPGLIVDAVVVDPFGAHPSLRPGRLRPRQPLLPRLGPDQPRRGEDPGLAPRLGLRPGRTGTPTWRSWARSARRAQARQRPVGLGRLRDYR